MKIGRGEQLANRDAGSRIAAHDGDRFNHRARAQFAKKVITHFRMDAQIIALQEMVDHALPWIFFQVPSPSKAHHSFRSYKKYRPVVSLFISRPRGKSSRRVVTIYRAPNFVAVFSKASGELCSYCARKAGKIFV